MDQCQSNDKTLLQGDLCCAHQSHLPDRIQNLGDTLGPEALVSRSHYKAKFAIRSSLVLYYASYLEAAFHRVAIALQVTRSMRERGQGSIFFRSRDRLIGK